MNQKSFRSLSLISVQLSLILFGSLVFLFPHSNTNAQSENAAGALTVIDSKGAAKSSCPLKHTDVKVEISGFLSRVVVTQEFQNSFQEKIEAVYTFPLPHDAAIDDMTMLIGTRTVRGKILPREEAQMVYEAAKAGGQVASLLDQERPNIFTQSVANILPGEQIKITISYVETLKYDAGSYQFVFPMVVGPRYVPGNPTAPKEKGFSPSTDRVPDAPRITPKPMPAGMRAGHDISLDIALDAGLMIDKIASKSHEVNINRPDARSARVHLTEAATIPNKDFILSFDVAGQSIQDALLTHRSERGGYFTVILQPPDRVQLDDVTPKELVFVLDTSGSMGGFPIEKAKETMKLALEGLYPADTFNLITFSGDTHILFPEPVPATKDNLRKAQTFLESRSGEGGTEMMTAIKAALDPSDNQKHVRIVCFMTDGYVGNDMEIISEVQKHPNARVFAFGIGDSVNRFLLDNMATSGLGEVEYVGLKDDGSGAAQRFHERIRNPLLTDISVDWNGLPVADVYPVRVPDLFSAKPVVLTGRFTSAAHGTIRLKGKMAGTDYVREIPIDFPETMASHDVLASLWARQRVEDLMRGDLAGMQQGTTKPDVKQAITQLGLEYRLMTQFTSFVAVEEMVVTEGGQPRRVDVPVELPEGVNPQISYGGENTGSNNMTFGQFVTVQSSASPMNSATVNYSVTPTVRKPSRRAKPAGNVKSSPHISGGGGSGGGGGIAAGTGSSAAGVMPARAAVAIDAEKVIAPLTADQVRMDELLKKAHPSLVALIIRLGKKETSSALEEAKFVRDGKAELQVWLTEKSDRTLGLLKELGLEVTLNPTTSKLVIGRVSMEKIEGLVKLDFVRYVSQQFVRDQ